MLTDTLFMKIMAGRINLFWLGLSWVLLTIQAFAQMPSSLPENKTNGLRNPLQAPSAEPFNPEGSANNPEIRAFINRISADQNIDPQILRQVLQKAQWSQDSLNFTQPLEPQTIARTRNWSDYRKRYVSLQRLDSGIDFYLQNRALLQKAEREFGVSQWIIASILNIESRYGAKTGKYLALDTLATLAFYHATRKSYFQQELAELIRLWRAGVFNIETLTGSFAGAVGIPQFMPSNINVYGVDFDGNGHIDLNTLADAIGSVAHYLAKHQWQNEEDWQAMLVPISLSGVDNERIQKWLSAGPKPNITAQAWSDLNAQVDSAEQRQRNALRTANMRFPVSLVDLPSPLATQYRLGSQNFYALTRYNKSFDYASAVYDLAKALECTAQSTRTAECLNP